MYSQQESNIQMRSGVFTHEDVIIKRRKKTKTDALSDFPYEASFIQKEKKRMIVIHLRKKASKPTNRLIMDLVASTEVQWE